jgi:hypothetical protein
MVCGGGTLHHLAPKFLLELNWENCAVRPRALCKTGLHSKTLGLTSRRPFLDHAGPMSH